MRTFLLTKCFISKTIPPVKTGLHTRVFGIVRFGQSVASQMALLAAALVTSSWCDAAALAQPHAVQSKSKQAAKSSAESATVLPQTPRTLAEARQAVNRDPEDAQAHYQLGELLREAGRGREAAEEYLIATSLKHDLYVAYHQLAVVCDDPSKLDEAIERLTSYMQERPRVFMLRVALSELCEKRGDYYKAAKALIDLQYDSGIPKEYVSRVNTRIHFLLTEDREQQVKQQEQPVATDEELGIVPSPIPEDSLRNGLAAAKIKDSKELKGMGHVPLLP